MELRMQFKMAVLLVAAGAWLGALASVASAADCGTPGAPPCKPDRIAPKPVSTERIGKTPPGNSALLPEPPKRAASPAAEKAAAGGSRKPPAEPQAAVDVKLSKIPDIIAPEPKDHAQPQAEARPSSREPDRESEPGIAPLSPSDKALLQRHDPMP
jgi:hypothetical protein